ncbi:hypothetical protein DES53_105203 [Roseimicrobium gellanilyticum]|uniref:Uncharacterized protein n=1 Tax=Roseimicrobium gellanilyticum TaxID=748857 RepID=A0A366HLQ6_9BACT|nr:hypothetical protein [Roseimicrobium gellanilyticum]RBP43804.1 hypothetical protein DES53_105203 [Roseimicrobium gellanilyticum]
METLHDGLPKNDAVRVVGRLESLGSQTERFDCLQRQAMLLRGAPVYPKGVFKFKTYEEADAWMGQIRYVKPQGKTQA